MVLLLWQFILRLAQKPIIGFWVATFRKNIFLASKVAFG